MAIFNMVGGGGKGSMYKNFSAMQGPCPTGFHIPMNTEWQLLYDIGTQLGLNGIDDFKNYLKLPLAGNRSAHATIQGNNIFSQGKVGGYRSCITTDSTGDQRAFYFRLQPNYFMPQGNVLIEEAYSIRPFKDAPITPTSSWTKLYGTSIEAGGIFRNSTDGLISISSDGINWITIADKNVGATTVWNSGNSLSEANCGKYYQRGNNYGFPRTGTVTTSKTQVDASNYGPGNYYNSSIFLTAYSWDSSKNKNLWGGITGVIG